MRVWKTQDEPTNSNLALLETLVRSGRTLTADILTSLVGTIIQIEEMFPGAVRAHFRLPYLFIGNAQYDWSQDRLEEWWSELTAAVETGLHAVEADTSLQKGGSATLNDRPATRGEELKAACRDYSDHRSADNLDALRFACSAPGLGNYFDRLTYWLGRKRPAPGRRPIASEIWIAMSNIETQIDYYHHHKASYRYTALRQAEDLRRIEVGVAPPIEKERPTESPQGFLLGERVHHKKFGLGTITDIDGERIEADFDISGSKRILETFLTRDSAA
jgi:hypothetical protein